jgi:hypothetical protein
MPLYDNPPFAPEAARIRQILVEQSAIDSATPTLEGKFARWAQSKERAAGAGFTRDAEGAEKIFYLYILAKARHADAQAFSHRHLGKCGQTACGNLSIHTKLF